MPPRLAAVLIVASLAFGALLAAGLVLLLRDSDGENGALATMSARERPVTIAVPERIGPPNTPRLTGEALLIGERAGFRFLRLPREDGSSCFAYSERRSGDWQLLGFNCETGFQRFPDPAQPVMTVRARKHPLHADPRPQRGRGLRRRRRQAHRGHRRPRPRRADRRGRRQHLLQHRTGRPGQGARRARRGGRGHLAPRRTRATRRVMSSRPRRSTPACRAPSVSRVVSGDVERRHGTEWSVGTLRLARRW